MRCVRLLVTLLAVGLTTSGCIHARQDQAKAGQTSPAAAETEVKLQSGDKVHIVVFGEDKITGEYELDARGRVILQLGGAVDAALSQIEPKAL